MNQAVMIPIKPCRHPAKNHCIAISISSTKKGSNIVSPFFGPQMLERLRKIGFEVLELHHAEAILVHDMPEALRELEDVLTKLRIPIEEIVGGGGGEAQGTQRTRRALANRGWLKRNIEIRKFVDGEETQSLSHEIDHVKSFGGWTFALEIEWNNKYPFFDRDLENFKRLHAEGAVSIGGIITRGDSLQANLRDMLHKFAVSRNIQSVEDLDEFGYEPTRRQLSLIAKRTQRLGDFQRAWAEAFVADKFGEATTHWRKLKARVDRGVGNPCPLLLLGIPSECVEL